MLDLNFRGLQSSDAQHAEHATTDTMPAERKSGFLKFYHSNSTDSNDHLPQVSHRLFNHSPEIIEQCIEHFFKGTLAFIEVENLFGVDTFILVPSIEQVCHIRNPSKSEKVNIMTLF